jgi:hypothetical protein
VIIKNVKDEKPVAVSMVQRHLSAKTSITDIAADVENDHRETARKLAQAHGVSTKMVHANLCKDPKLSEKFARWLSKLTRKEIKKKQAIHSDFCHGFFTILDNVLTGGESALGEEGADFQNPHPGGFLKNWDRGTRNLMAVDLAVASWWWYECSRKCLAICLTRWRNWFGISLYVYDRNRPLTPILRQKMALALSAV